MTKERWTKATSMALLATLLIACWLAGLAAFVRDASFPPVAEPLQPLDAVVALTGGSNRLDTAFDLLERDAGKKLFVSGVYRGTDIAELLNNWKDEPQKKLDCCVVLGFEADDTAGNAVETVAWLRKEGFRSFYLVTSNYHMARALLEFKAIAPDLEIVTHPVMPKNVDMRNWWRTPGVRNLILREYTKYIAAYILHHIPR